MKSDIIIKYFPGLTDGQIAQYERIGQLYPEWNDKINVISRKDINNLYTNHILHSLSIAKLLGDLKPGTSILDIGTGGGFPGIPLAIIYPQCDFHLIDRIGKKIKVVAEVASAIGLGNVTFQHGDIGECHDRYDFVVSRAVMRLNDLVRLVRKNVRSKSVNAYRNGIICLKGGDISDESEGIGYQIIDYPVNEFFDEEYFSTKKIIYLPF